MYEKLPSSSIYQFLHISSVVPLFASPYPEQMPIVHYARRAHIHPQQSLYANIHISDQTKEQVLTGFYKPIQHMEQNSMHFIVIINKLIIGRFSIPLIKLGMKQVHFQKPSSEYQYEFPKILLLHLGYRLFTGYMTKRLNR